MSFVAVADSTKRSRLRNALMLLAAVGLVLSTSPALAQETVAQEVSADDADFLFDFADDPLGERPGYVSVPWQQSAVTVVESEWALNGRALQIAPYGTSPVDNAFFAAVFGGVPDAADVEVLMRFRDMDPGSPLHWMTGAGARIDRDEVTAVLTQSREGAEGLVVARVNDGDFGTLNNGYTHNAFAKGNYLRARWQGGVASAKMWGGTLAEEPADWQVSEQVLSEPTLAAGGVGITRYFSEHTSEIDYLAIDILGDSAPPTTTITSGPEGTVDSPTATFTFEADVVGSTFECRLDAAPWTACESPYELSDLTDGTYTFEVKATALGLTGDAVSRSWVVELPVPTFSDVPLDHPFFVEIESLAEQDVIRGFGDGTFRPTVDVTRQAAVAFLYRVAGEPAVTFSQEFDDVGPEHPFAIEITWAVQEGVTTGFPDGTFRPTDTVTRRASSALLFRFAGEPAGDFAASAAAAFTDVTTDTAFANEIGWMVDAGITTGFPDDTFRPGISVTRQAQAAFLYRYQQL